MQEHYVMDIVGKTKLWLGIALAVMLIGFIGLTIKGLNLGLDFTSGALYQFRFPEKVATTLKEETNLVEKVRLSLKQAKLPPSSIQIAEGDTLLIRIQVKNEEESERYRSTLNRLLLKSYPKIREESVEFIGPVVGKELTTAAILGTILGLLGVSLWILARYRFLNAGWSFAVGALIALAHDILVTVGFTAWMGIEVNNSFIAALLTVAGYSINDTVVIYDRIRENSRIHAGWQLERIVNHSLFETMARSINTVLTTEFSILAVLFLGGVAVKPLAYSLLIGITSGAYSSIFVAAPLVLLMQKWWQAKQVKKRPTEAPSYRPVAQPYQRSILHPTFTPSRPSQEVEQPVGSSQPKGNILRPSTPTVHRKHKKKKRR